MSALILDGQSRAALETVQALGRAGVAVTVAAHDGNATAFRSRYATRQVEQPPALPAHGFLSWLRELDDKHGFRLIVPSTENSLQAFLLVPESDGLRVRAVLPSNRSLEIALDKRRCGELAERLGIPVPATRVVDDASISGKAPVFPVVLKPERSKLAGGGELRTCEPVIVADESVWRCIIAEWAQRMIVLEQEYVSGWGVGVEFLYRNGNMVWYVAHERLHEWPLTGGASTYRRTIEPPPAMLEMARRLLDALEWNGAAMVEFKRRADGSFVFMEVNPRLWGSLALSIDAGVNFPLGLWQLANGQQTGPQPVYRCGLRTRLLGADLNWLKANLVADRPNPLLLLRPRVRSLLEPALVLLGRERWDHFSWRDPGPFLHDTRRGLRSLTDAAWYRWRVRAMLLRRRRLIRRACSHLEALRGSRTPRILFVCQANICRSQFAELAARARLAGCDIESAGFDGRAGRSTPPNVAEQAGRMGFDMSACRSTSLTVDHVRRADLILVMELSQWDRVAAMAPEAAERTLPLGLLAATPSVEIEDPYCRDASAVQRALGLIASAIDGLKETFHLEHAAPPAPAPVDRAVRASRLEQN